jgi:succinoglycan biosynthesis transport protein ExoP
MSRSHEKPEADRTDYSPLHGSLGLLQIAWKRKPLIALGTVVGLLAGWVYYLQRDPVYESTTQVQVERNMPNTSVIGMDPSFMGYDDYLATQMEIIKSPRIVGEAVRKNELDKLASFAGKGDPTATIRGSLTVTRTIQSSSNAPTNIINLSFRGPKNEDCEIVLRAITDAFHDYLKKVYESQQTKSLDELKQMHDDLQDQKTDARKKLRVFNLQHREVPSKDGEGSYRVELLRKQQTARADVAFRLVDTQVHLDAIKKAVEKGDDPTPYIVASIEAGSGDISLTNPEGTLAGKLEPLQTEELYLLGKFGPDHPDVKEIRARIAAAKEVWAQTHPALPKDGNATPKDRMSKEAVAAHIQLLQNRILNLKLTEDACTKITDHMMDEFRDVGTAADDEDALRKNLATTEKLDNAILDHMQAASLVRKTGGYHVEVISPPVPGYQVEPKPAPIVIASLIGGMLLGIGMAWLAEVTDQSFRSPEDIRKRLKVQVLGHVPRIEPTEEDKAKAESGLLPMDPSICAYYLPKSVDAEAFRGLRTTLFFKLEGEGHKVIQVTSPNMGDGKTTLATNLAVSIAQSGKRTLLIDADFRRPRLHKMFGLDATTGLASVIAEGADLQEAIQPCIVPNLFLLPCGPRPSNPAELLTSQKFIDFLDTLRKQFDIILVDTPPLLAVSDPSVVAPRVDGVLLTIRVAKNGRPAAERARELLANLGANVYGVVVNGIDAGSAQESYGQSQYGYSYHYAYGYTYEAADNSSYYLDADADVPIHHTNGANGANGTATLKSESRRHKADEGGMLHWLRSRLWH